MFRPRLFNRPKSPVIRDCSHQSRGCQLNPADFLFLDLVFSDNKKVIERTKLLFPVSSVNDINDVVSLLSIAIVFLVIAFSQTN